jgi:hypothetical protein
MISYLATIAVKVPEGVADAPLQLQTRAATVLAALTTMSSRKPAAKAAGGPATTGSPAEAPVKVMFWLAHAPSTMAEKVGVALAVR